MFEPVDLTEMESLLLWIKTKGSTTGPSQIVLEDSNGNSRVLEMFSPTSYPQWSKLTLSLTEFHSEDSEFNEKSVNKFSIRSTWGIFLKEKQSESFLDDIKWTKQIISLDEPETKLLTVSTNKDFYSSPE